MLIAKPVRWTLLALLVLLPITGLLTVHFRGKRAAARAKAALLTVGIDVDHPPAPRPADATARQLEPLAAKAGIDLVPEHRGARSGSPMPKGMGTALSDYLAQASWSRERTPPPEVRKWLDDNAAALTEVELWMTTREPPRWEEDVWKIDSPLPNLLGCQRLHRALLARALAATDPAESERALHAAWQLDRAQLQRTEVISVLMGMAGTRTLGEALREIDVDPDPWLRRIEEAETDVEQATKRMMRAYPLAPWLMAHDLPTATAAMSGHRVWRNRRERVLAGLAQPFVLADFSGRVEDTLAALRELEAADPCAEPASVPTPWPRRVTADAWFEQDDITEPWARMRRVQLDLELTRRVLLVKRMRREGTLPDSGPIDLGPTRLPCATLVFRSEMLPDGRAMVAFEDAIPWKVEENRHRPVPRRWEERKAPIEPGALD